MESYFEQPNVTAAIEEWTIMDDEFKAFCYALKLTSSDFLSLKKDSNRTYMAIRKWLSTPRTRRDFAQVLFNFKNISLSIKLGFEKDVKAIQDGKILPEEPVSPIEAVASNQSKETMTSFSGSNNPFAAAMAKKNQVLTVEKFVKAKDNWLARICVAANTHGSWQRLLGDLGLLTSPDIEKIVREYNRIWRDTKANNPMYDILVQLCLDSKFANQSVDDFSALLKTLQNPDLTAVLREWDEFRGTKVAKEVTNNIQAYDGANELKRIVTEISNPFTLFSIEVTGAVVRATDRNAYSRRWNVQKIISKNSLIIRKLKIGTVMTIIQDVVTVQDVQASTNMNGMKKKKFQDA